MVDGRVRPGTGDTPAATPAAPAVRFDDPARDHRPIGLEQLPDRYQAELIKSAELGQVRAVEGSVGHVEVFQMGGVGTSMIGRPRPLPRTTTPQPPPFMIKTRLHPRL